MALHTRPLRCQLGESRVFLRPRHEGPVHWTVLCYTVLNGTVLRCTAHCTVPGGSGRRPAPPRAGGCARRSGALCTVLYCAVMYCTLYCTWWQRAAACSASRRRVCTAVWSSVHCARAAASAASRSATTCGAGPCDTIVTAVNSVDAAGVTLSSRSIGTPPWQPARPARGLRSAGRPRGGPPGRAPPPGAAPAPPPPPPRAPRGPSISRPPPPRPRASPPPPPSPPPPRRAPPPARAPPAGGGRISSDLVQNEAAGTPRRSRIGPGPV
eukprot:1195456-Prorocentrum_minimum.AAC.2